jgi:CheY-like chemotaxis protein
MKRIPIADDSAVVRRGLRELIEHTLDWDVCGEAVNGAEAIERAREPHPDMLLLDFAMPGMNGFDTARELAKVEPNLPVLLCGSTLQSLSERGREDRHPGSRVQVESLADHRWHCRCAWARDFLLLASGLR